MHATCAKQSRHEGAYVLHTALGLGVEPIPQHTVFFFSEHVGTCPLHQGWSAEAG